MQSDYQRLVEEAHAQRAVAMGEMIGSFILWVERTFSRLFWRKP